MKAAASPAQAQAHPVGSEQLKLLYEAIPIAMFATVINGLVLTVVLWNQVPGPRLLGWLAALILISAGRYVLAHAYLTSQATPPDQTPWQRRFDLGVIVGALAWGGSVLVIFPAASAPHQILLALVIAGVCAGAVSTLSYQWRAIAVFLAITLLPLIIRFMLGGDEVSQAVALLAMLFLLMLLISARRIYNTNQSNLMLSASAAAMAADAKAAAERFRHLLQATPDALLIVDSGHRIEYANQRAEQVFGYGAGSLIGQPIARLLPELNAQAGELPGQGSRRDLTARTRLGKEFPSDVSFSTVPFPEGSRLCLTVRDVSERREIEDSLRQAKLAAEAANQAKSAFLSSMSHELRTPLNAILGFTELLREEANLTPEQRESLGEIYDSGEHLLKLINDILDLSKIEAGRMQLSIEPVCLGDITDTCRSMIEPMARKHGIALHFEMEHCRDTRVLADRTRLLQSLLNLASNAIKYNHAGGSVTLSCEQRPSGRLRLSVQDTGPGIHPERQRDLFQPFSRLGKEFSRIEGTGIGLALTKQIVELMQGELGFTSSPGQGSTFWLEFPCAGADAADTSAPGGEIVSVAEAATLLAIEDNPLNQHMLRQILTRQAHYHLLQADTPAHGLELARRAQPALILLDINMPGMNGFEVLTRLRADPGTRQIPVIAVTAMNPAEAAVLLSGGFDAILRKPIDKGALLATIGQVLERRVAPPVGQP